MVWTCCFTGKSNLTYQEALESEENAKKSIKEFPLELRVPVLYIATKTSRTSFGEMAEDVFLYTKDRYFIGENLEASFTSNKWIESHVLQVLSPAGEDIEKSASPKNGLTKHSNPSPHLYKYEIEHLDADDADISEIMIVDCNQIKRKKGNFSREKCKLFLKQYVEQDSRGVFVIKESARKEFNLDSMKFDKIFNGPDPVFEHSKKLDKLKDKEANGKKKKQMTLGNYLKSNKESKNNGDNNKSSNAKEKKTNLLDQMEKRKEEFDRLKKQHEEDMIVKKQQEKEMIALKKKYVRDWFKPKEDLELEDQQALPVFPVVMSKIPEKYLGDVLMVLEFIDLFNKDILLKNYFSILNLNIIENALIDMEVAGQFYSLIEMLLMAVFRQQETEVQDHKISVIEKHSVPKPPTSNSLKENAYHATWAAAWPKQQHGLKLSELPLSALSITEILRIHLLASGAQVTDAGEKSRLSNRGGYVNTDDPGLYLRVHKPHIIKFLANKHISQLKLKDRIDIVTCLIDQLLTYSDFRNKIEDRLQKRVDARLELRSLVASEKRREIENVTKRKELIKDSVLNSDLKAKKMQEMEDVDTRAKDKHEKEMEKLQKDAYENFLGLDRAYRKYWRLDSLPGVLINCEEDNHGPCLDEPIIQKPELIGAKDAAIFKHVQDSLENSNSSNKENDMPETVLNSNTADNDNDILLMCSSNKLNCKVHSNRDVDRKWRFIADSDQFEQLLLKLNPRGIRESELQQTLQNDKKQLLRFIKDTPIDQLNEEEAQRLQYVPKETPTAVTRSKKNIDPNLGYPLGTPTEDILLCCLTEDLLELEEKIFSGSLGQLFVSSRAEWRQCLTNKDFDNFDKNIVHRADVEQEEKDDDDDEIVTETRNRKYVDPGNFLSIAADYSSDSEDDEGVEVKSEQSVESQVAVECLSIALAQIAQAIERRYLKKPLGDAKVRSKKDSIYKIRNRLSKWEQSLLSSTSLSQIYLHYYNLDSCICWHRSTLNAYCRICRRRTDSENMLLCDSCNRGHHLYCLKPKLNKIPKGDWYCDLCSEENNKQLVINQEVMPVKKKRVFKEKDDDDKISAAVYKEESENEDEPEKQSNQSNSSSDDSSDENMLDIQICDVCKSGGILTFCDKCETPFHKECVDVPVNTRGKKWLCAKCNRIKDSKEEQDDKLERGLRRSKRDKSFANDDDSDSEEEVHSKKRRSYRAESGRDDLPLHNAMLQDLLTEVMKHEASWPFLRPVLQKEVPDYYDVISNPMDFGTIKYKLNMGEYMEDVQVMDDVALVFANCSTYNDSSSEIYSCALRLYEFFIEKCDELGLKIDKSKVFSELDFELPKKRRRK